MATNFYDTILESTTDAQFRSWGLAFHNSLIAVGLTNTADTGQIDFTTVLIPAPGASGGYKIYRFNDALQASAPIFIRIDYGIDASGAAVPQMWVQIGTATDGAGTLTGVFSDVLRPMCKAGAIDSLVTPYITYMCYNATVGALTVAWKLGSNGLHATGRGFLAIGRSCDSDGAPTNTGATIFTFGVSTLADAQSLRFPSVAGAFTRHNNYCVQVGDTIGTVTAGAVQASICWAHYPRVEPIQWLAGVVTDEFPRGTEFPAALVGAVPHTYIALGEQSPPPSYGVNITHFSFCMLYE